MIPGLVFRPTVLDVSHGDWEAMLVFRNDRLAMVLSRLGDLHAELTGHWFVETTFADQLPPSPVTFETLETFEAWLAEAG